MVTEAIFKNIAERICLEISKSHKSIIIAVTCFTNKSLFDELLAKASEGCMISLIISDDLINANSRIDYEQLRLHNSSVYKIGDGEKELMHNKFCVIDHSTVITGSYNWSCRAENNFENIIINYNDTALAQQFISEFYHLRKKFFPDEPKEKTDFPIGKVIKRMEILKNYILLEEFDELNQAAARLTEYEFNSDIAAILNDIKQKQFADAITKIHNFSSSNTQVATYADPEIIGLKFELKILENQVNAFDNERIDLQKLLSDFQHRHSQELGNIIIEILRIRKLIFCSDESKFKEAENDERHYREQVDTDKNQQKFELTEEEKKELKKKFRMATVLCHPDKVNEKQKEAAQAMFIRLKEAYDANDLKQVAEILSELEKGNFFKSKSDSVSERELLKMEIAKLRQRIKSLENEIVSIKESDTFKTVNSINNWDAYFNEMKVKLEGELEEMKKEIES